MRDLKRIIGDSATGGVSRFLELAGRSWAMLVGQQEKPLLDSEVNFLGELSLWLRNEGLRAQTREAGFLYLNGLPTVDTGNTKVVFGDGNTTPFYVLVNGHVLEVTAPVADYPELAVAYTAGHDDYLFLLEVWFEEIEPTSATEGAEEIVAKYGNDDDGTGWTNDLEDEAIGDETSRRVQARYKLRSVYSVDFATYPEGMEDGTHVKCSRNTSYTYTEDAVQVGLYVAGDGSEAAASALGTVDGYVYAIPLARMAEDDASVLHVFDLRHNLQPLHNLDALPAYRALFKALAGAEDSTEDGVFTQWGDGLLVTHSRYASNYLYANVAAGVALVDGVPYYHEATEEILIGDDPIVLRGQYRSDVVVVECHKRSKLCQLRVVLGAEQGTYPAPLPDLVDDEWVCQIPLANILWMLTNGNYHYDDARVPLLGLGNFDSVYIRQDGGSASNSAASATLGGYNGGSGIGVKGTSVYGPALRGQSTYGHGLEVSGAAIIQQLSPAYLAQRFWWAVHRAAWTMGSSIDYGRIISGPRYLYALNAASDKVVRLDPYDISAVDSVAIGGDDPRDICFDGQYLWTVNYGDSTVSKIQARDMTLVDDYSLGVTISGTYPHIAFDGQYVWAIVATAAHDTVLVKINPATGAVVDTYNIDTFAGGQMLPIVQGNNVALWIVPATADKTLRRFNQSGVQVSTYTCTWYPRTVEYDGANLWVYTAIPDVDTPYIEAFNPASLAQVYLLTPPTATAAGGGMAFDGWRMWFGAGMGGGPSVQAIDVATGQFITASELAIDTSGGNPPSGFVVDPAGGVWAWRDYEEDVIKVY